MNFYRTTIEKLWLGAVVFPLSILPFGCVDSNTLIEPIEEECRISHSSTGVESLIQKAAEKRRQIYGTIPTRGEDVRIESVGISARGSSHSQVYILNYGDGEGFAVVTDCPGLDPVQAVSSEGRLYITDTIANKGLAAFFSSLDEQIQTCDGMSVSADTTIVDFNPLVRNEYTDKVTPNLSQNVRKWHQDSPYNMFCPKGIANSSTNLLTNCKVGCMALSATQIMSYHEWPQTIGSLRLDWNAIKGDNSLLAYELLALVGSEDYLDLSYGVSETAGFNSKMPELFEKCGYKPLNGLIRFEESAASMDIKKNGPLLVHGYLDKDEFLGHFFVIDGYIHDHKEVRVVSVDSSGEQWENVDSYLFHCVWGLRENGDGYFRWSRNYCSIGKEDPEKRDPSDRKGSGVPLYWVSYYTDFAKQD